jgi:hypothetical protein
MQLSLRHKLVTPIVCSPKQPFRATAHGSSSKSSLFLLEQGEVDTRGGGMSAWLDLPLLDLGGNVSYSRGSAGRRAVERSTARPPSYSKDTTFWARKSQQWTVENLEYLA